MENYVLMYWSSEFVEKFEIVEWTKLCKLNGKSKFLNIPNHENSMESCVHSTYKYSGLVGKFDFVESTKSWKFKRKLCRLDVQIVRICWLHKILKVENKIV